MACVMVRCSDEELERWKKAAEDAGYKQLAPFVRLALGRLTAARLDSAAQPAEQ